MAKAVLVTGASTGIGEATARRLKRAGWDVFAAARKDADLERLGGEGFTPVKLDVTDPDSIAAAKKQLDERGLHGLVNNAGVAVSGPMEFLPLDELRHQLEVNLVGQVAVIQAFMPNIREAKGRIVNVSSIGGKMALPLVGPYAASKFGARGGQRLASARAAPMGDPRLADRAGRRGHADLGQGPRDRRPARGGDGRAGAGALREARGQDPRRRPRRSPSAACSPTRWRRRSSRRSPPRARSFATWSGGDAKMRLRIKALVGDRGMDALIARTLDWK